MKDIYINPILITSNPNHNENDEQWRKMDLQRGEKQTLAAIPSLYFSDSDGVRLLNGV